MKKILSMLMTLTFVMSFITGCSAAEQPENEVKDNTSSDFTLIMQIGSSNMTVNGVEKSIDDEGSTPVIVNGSTLLPIRAIVEEMGGNVFWDNKSQTVNLICEL